MEDLIITPRQIKAFKAQMREDEKSEATVQKYLHDLNCFALFCRDRPVNKTLVTEYKAKPATFARYTNDMRNGNKSKRTLPHATRQYYTFNGWFTKVTGGIRVTENSVFNDIENITLYAQWTRNEFTVTLDANGGTCSVGSRYTVYNYTYSASLPTPTMDYYTFDGRYTAATGGGGAVKGVRARQSRPEDPAAWVGCPFAVKGVSPAVPAPLGRVWGGYD